MIRYQTLAEVSPATLLETFNAAFADYQVGSQLTPDQFAMLLRRNGCKLNYSFGAFADRSLVGFVINGVRELHGVLTAYDSGTGVLPAYRNQGITTAILDQLATVLRQRQIRQYLLEVIQTNAPAVKIYQRQGFAITREFHCYKAAKSNLTLRPNHSVEILAPQALPWEQLDDCGAYQPSWQNNRAAVLAIPDRCHAAVVRIDGTIAGYGICDKVSGAFYQLAVAEVHRGKGIGTSLVGALLERSAPDTASFINIDSRNATMIHFLTKAGFTNFIMQYEMALQL